MNLDWALGELERFRALLEYRDRPGLYAATYVGTRDELEAQRVVVDRIFAQTIGPRPVVPLSGNDPRRPDRDWTIRCIESIKREAEIRENLGEDAPNLHTHSLHPWIWDGARSLWRSGHYAEAVEGAAKKLNAESQNKIGRRDISETDLVNQAFSDDPPAIGKPRMRPVGDDDGKTARSLRRGIRAFAEGCFAAIRNPASHDGGELSETQALERLAAFSILARWIDDAEVREASG